MYVFYYGLQTGNVAKSYEFIQKLDNYPNLKRLVKLVQIDIPKSNIPEGIAVFSRRPLLYIDGYGVSSQDPIDWLENNQNQ
jgi:hypothetical protein